MQGREITGARRRRLSSRLGARAVVLASAGVVIVAGLPQHPAAPQAVVSPPTVHRGVVPLPPSRLVSSQPVTFATPATYSNGSTAARAVTGDGNGDFSPDVLTANSDSGGTVSFLANQVSGGHNTGTLSQPALLSVANAGTVDVAPGDFNHDGALDLAVSTGGQTVGVMLGRANGTFAPISATQTLPTTNAGAYATRGVAVADVNGDGNLDLVYDADTGCVCQAESAVAMLPGNGDGTFGPFQTYGIPWAGLGSNGGVTGMALANFDGVPGAVVGIANTGGGNDSGSIWVLPNFNNGTSAVEVATQNGVRAANGEAIAVGDFNHDGKPDIVAAETPICCGGSVQRGVSVYMNNGGGGVQPGVYYQDSLLTDGTNDFGGVDSVAVADLNGDGAPDIITAVHSSNGTGLSIYMNAGSGTFTGPYFIATGFQATTMTAADLNGDGLPDVVLGSSGTGNNVMVLLNTTARPPKAVEFYGCGSPSEPDSASAHGCSGDPVDTATGNFWQSFTDLSVPGRGIALDFMHTYNSLAAASGAGGPMGPGWSISYGISLAQDPGTGAVTITEEGGSQVTFTQQGSSFVAPPRVVATLTKNADGTWTFTRHGRETFTFSSAGRATQEKDLNGYVTAFGYNANNQLTSVTDPAGRSLTLAYTGSNLTGVSDPLGRSVSFSYDAAGNLSTATDANGGVTRFTYDSSHRVLTETDPRNGVLTNTYDTQGRIASQTDQLNRKTTFAYTGDNQSGAGGTTSVTDPNGNVRQEQYVNSERVSETKAAGTSIASTWQFTYDPNTLGVATVTDPNNNTTRTTYDANGDVLTQTDGLNRTTTSTYDALGDVLTTTDPLNTTTTATYDAAGNMLTRSTPLTGTTQSKVTQFQYGSSHPGDVTAVVDPDGKTWTLGYDQYGNRTSLTDPLGNTTTYTFDLAGRMLTKVSPNGNVAGGTPSAFTTTITYTPRGDVTSVTDPLGHRTSYQYDLNRNRTSATDGNARTTTYTYDAANQLTQATRVDGSNVKSGYDADGNLVTETDELGHTTTFAYDAQNRRVSSTDPLNRQTTYVYDQGGREVFMTDPQNRTTTTSYDQADETTAISYSDGVTPNVTFTYDADGQRQTMADGSGHSAYTFDSLHRLTKMVNGAGQAVLYSYDLKGQVTSITYPISADVVNRTYDGAGRLASVADWLGNTTGFTYDADGNLTVEAFPVPGGTDRYQYDAADHLMGVTDATTSAGTFLNLSYQRDADAQVTAESATTDGYDTVNRLINQSGTSFGYDAADDPTNVRGATLTYDVANQPQTMSGSKLTQFAYDADGNRVATTVGNSATNYAYDEANRLTGYTANAQYTYNGDGLRATKILAGPLAKFATMLPSLVAKGSGNGGGTTDTFTWDTAEGSVPLLLQKSNANEVDQFIYGPGGTPLEQVISTNVWYFHHDQLGSTRALTSSSGAVAASFSYDGYGKTAASSGNVTTPFLFAGQYQDAESGLYYMRNRYYDPVTAQFTSRDPLANLTQRPYAYANDNPVNAIDPLGLDPCSTYVTHQGLDACISARDCRSLSECSEYMGADERELRTIQYQLAGMTPLDCPRDTAQELGLAYQEVYHVWSVLKQNLPDLTCTEGPEQILFPLCHPVTFTEEAGPTLLEDAGACLGGAEFGIGQLGPMAPPWAYPVTGVAGCGVGIGGVRSTGVNPFDPTP